MNALEKVPSGFRNSAPIKKLAKSYDAVKASNKRLREEIASGNGLLSRSVSFGEAGISAYVCGRIDSGRQPIKLGKLEMTPSMAVGTGLLILGMFTGSDHAYAAANGALLPHFYLRGVDDGVKAATK